MRKIRSLFYPILIFVIAQLAWILVLGLWIYRYITNNMIFNEVGDRISPRLIAESTNVWALVGGLVLMVMVSVAMTLIFRHLTIQLKINRLYDKFIANVTHELKSPLASIQLYLETLKTRKVPADKQQEFYSIMLRDTERLQKHIDTILNISGIEQHKYAYSFKVVQAESAFSDLIQEVLQHFKLPPKVLTITGSAPCACVIDPNAMRTVFDNLVDNAIKYSQGEPKIHMDLCCSSSDVLIRFQDHGIGIPLKDQKKIFNKFHRVTRRDIPNVKGTGLGLYWVKEIVKAHGGKVSVFSEGPGKGTAFRFRLPVYQARKKRYINGLLKITQKRIFLEGEEHGQV